MLSPMTDVEGRPRAAALPSEERRSEIIKATMPLFLEHGSNVTTRGIAAAAGIAEGTIFRVFADKNELIEAVIDRALDIAPANAYIAAIDASLPLREQLVMVVEKLRKRVLYLFKVFSVATATNTKTPVRTSSELPALTSLFAQHADEIVFPPETAARILRGLTMACVHPSFGHTEPLTSEEIVSTLLDGIERTSERHGGPRC